MKTIVSCIDGSRSTIAICDYSAWASLRLAAPLTLLHVLEQASQVSSDLTGNIGLDSRENLLQELAELDEKRGRLAREHGQRLLEAATRCLGQLGVVNPNLLQRHGNLIDTLKAMEDDIRLLVIGRQGEHGQSNLHHIGGNVESVIRTLQCPVLVIPAEFVKPQRFLVAFDGSANGRRVVEHLVRSPLLNGLHCHLLMVVESSVDHQAQLEWAADELQRAGYTTHATISQGDVEDVLKAYCQEHAISLLAMGAYGHSRIRQFLVGSTTTSMLRWAKLPLLLLH